MEADALFKAAAAFQRLSENQTQKEARAVSIQEACLAVKLLCFCPMKTIKTTQIEH